MNDTMMVSSCNNQSSPPPTGSKGEFIHGIKNLFCLMRLSEPDDGKIVIAQESLGVLMNLLAPRSYRSLAKIDFSSLDNQLIQPLGVYGDQSALVDFLRKVTGSNTGIAAPLPEFTDQAKGDQNKSVLPSGLYFLLSGRHTSSQESSFGHPAFVIYWPEDMTWNDKSTGAVRRNRTTFMRYLTKMTPQIRCLMSKNLADAIIWKRTNRESLNGDTDDDDNSGEGYEFRASDNRYYGFEISMETREKEDAKLYPGFKYAYQAVISELMHRNGDTPPSIENTRLETKLVAGESSQGFLVPEWVSGRKDTKLVNNQFNKSDLTEFLERYKVIHLGNNLSGEGLSILMDEGGIKHRVPDLLVPWSIIDKARREGRQGGQESFVWFRGVLQGRLAPATDALRLMVHEVNRINKYGQTTFRMKGEVDSDTEPCIKYTLYSLDLSQNDRKRIQDDPLFIPSPQVGGMTTFNLSLQDTIRHVQVIGERVLLIADTPSGTSIWCSGHSHVGRDRPLKHFPSSQRRYHFSVHEQQRLLAAVCVEPTGEILIQILSFDETFSSLLARGSPQDITNCYQDGPPNLRYTCFADGSEEVCLVEGSGRIRIFSFISQGFRTDTLQLPSHIDVHSVHSSPDNSAMIVIERTSSDYQLRVYHWSSFGQLPQGIVLPLPDGLDLRSTTAFCVSSIGRRSNVAVIALIPSRNIIGCVNIQIKSKNTAQYFRLMRGPNPGVTTHNSLIDCFADVWSRYPVVPAIKRGTISTRRYEVPPRLTFVCDHESRHFSVYFRRMIKDFERVNKKPVERALDAIEIHAGTMNDLDWTSLEAGSFKAGEWFVELLCLLPVHIAIAHHNSFVPLKDGVLDPLRAQRLISATINQIIDSISLGWYESIFNSYLATRPVKVVSSMGEKSVGKSFTLNHLVDSSFTGAAPHATEGVWLSVCPTCDTLVVALKFEGVHSSETSTQEDMLLVLFNTAISNMVLYRSNFALCRDATNMFTSFQESSSLFDPTANPSLFKSLLIIIIKDVVEGDKEEIVEEFSSKFRQIVSDEQDTNFISVLHDSKLAIFPSPVIQSPSFYSVFSRLRSLLFKQPTTHTSAGEFLLTLKTLMAKLEAQDWGPIYQSLVQHRMALLMEVLPTAMTTGFADLHPEIKELKNLDNQATISWGDDSKDVKLCLSGSTADRTAPLLSLITNWRHDAARYDVEELSRHLCDLVRARLSHVHKWIETNTSRFPKDNADISLLKSLVDSNEELLKAGVQICRIDCSTCRLPCMLPKAHDSRDHICQTSHHCLESCEYIDEHAEDEETGCGLLAGHAGHHLCDPTAHTCGERCQLASHRGCQMQCMKVPWHPLEEGHICSARNHQCGKPCDLKDIAILSHYGSIRYSCPNFCVSAHDEDHENHVCGDRLICPIKCELCHRLCSTGDHLHGLLDDESHLCQQEHTCLHQCETPGICEINTEPCSVETIYSGAYESFQFTKYTQVANRLRCAVPIEPGKLDHAGPHMHNTAFDIFHYCDAKCDNCGYICHLPLNHPQREHETKHGSMNNPAWAVEGNIDAVVEDQGRKYAARNDGISGICSSVCTQLGRHAHIDYCRSQYGSCQGNESLHIKKRMLPNPDRPKDWISHKLFWARTGFKDPYSVEERAEFSKCDVLCASKEHMATATAPARPSECTLPIFHPPQPLDDWTGARNGYVSADGHAFACVHPNTMRRGCC